MKGLNRRKVLKNTTALAAFAPFFAACGPKAAGGEAAASDFVDGVRMAELLAGGALSPADAVDQAIARAEAVNPEINAIASPGFDAARERAASALTGDFAGVPTFIKDLADWSGLPTFYGSRAFRGYVAQEDGELAGAWRNLGVVPLGKSTSPEMGLISSTEPLVTGATRNPWDPSRIPGGSSGGAAALTAARVVPFAHASDGGGSIRVPAACCGLVGLKPSRGKLPVGRPGQEGNPVDLSVDLAVTHTVRDTAALFHATARPGQSGAPVTGPSACRLRIAFAPEPPNGAELDKEVRAELERTAALCSDLGHTVMETPLAFDADAFTEHFLLYWSAGASAFAARASEFTGKPPGPDILEPWTLALAQHFLERQGEMGAAIAYLQGFSTNWEATFEEGGFDLVLTPTVTTPPPPIGEQDPTGDFETVMAKVLDFACYTSVANVAGAASITLPLGETVSGLPIASMFTGKFGDDEMLLALAYELEAARGWMDRTPKIVAS